MRVKLDDNSLTSDISEILKDMQGICENEKKSFLNTCGDIIKKNVIRNLKRSKNHKSDYIHMADDVQVKIKTSRSGEQFLSVGGGKKTGYKWRFLNDGAIDQNGNVLNEANHFMEISMEDSNNAIEQETNEFLEKVVK